MPVHRRQLRAVRRSLIESARHDRRTGCAAPRHPRPQAASTSSDGSRAHAALLAGLTASRSSPSRSISTIRSIAARRSSLEFVRSVPCRTDILSKRPDLRLPARSQEALRAAGLGQAARSLDNAIVVSRRREHPQRRRPALRRRVRAPQGAGRRSATCIAAGVCRCIGRYEGARSGSCRRTIKRAAGPDRRRRRPGTLVDVARALHRGAFCRRRRHPSRTGSKRRQIRSSEADHRPEQCLVTGPDLRVATVGVAALPWISVRLPRYGLPDAMLADSRPGQGLCSGAGAGSRLCCASIRNVRTGMGRCAA